jgi:cysteine-S-conjugate beta-lyase
MNMKHIKFKTDRFNTHSRKYDSIHLNRYPKDTIPLWVADMDIEVDERILNGLHEYLDEKILGYNLETPEYTQAITNYLKRRHDCMVDSSWILTTPNVVSSINACLLALTHPNDAILILEPVYMPFFKSVEATGRQVVFSSLVHHPSGYEMNFEDIEHKIQEFNVKMVIFCSPHNPVGRVWREDELKRFVEIMNQNNVIIICDEIHMDFIFKGHKHIPMINFDEHVIMLMSASKTFNLASAHVSQIIAKSSSVRKKIMNLYHQLGLFHSVELGIRATTIAYQECDDYIDELCDVIETNVNLVKQCFENSCVSVVKMEGTYLMWLDVRACGIATPRLHRGLIKEAHVWLHDGSIFGPTGEGYLRLNCATSPHLLLEACERIKTWIKEHAHESKSSV